jgi:hypothetical protein
MSEIPARVTLWTQRSSQLFRGDSWRIAKQPPGGDWRRVTRVCCEGSDDDVGGTRHGGLERNPADQAGFSITHDPFPDLFPVPRRIKL